MFYTRTFVPTVLVLCGFALAFARPAACDIVTLHPAADADITSSGHAATINFGSEPNLFGIGNDFETSSILLRFDINNRNVSAIRSAHLRLWSTGWTEIYANTSPTTIFALSKPWAEKEVNWYYAKDGVGWQTPGGDLVSDGTQPLVFAANTQGIAVPSTGTASMEWDVTHLVRLWVNGKLRNNGLRIDTAYGLFLFESRESLFKNMCPELIIDIAR